MWHWSRDGLNTNGECLPGYFGYHSGLENYINWKQFFFLFVAFLGIIHFFKYYYSDHLLLIWTFDVLLTSIRKALKSTDIGPTCPHPLYNVSLGGVSLLRWDKDIGFHVWERSRLEIDSTNVRHQQPSAYEERTETKPWALFFTRFLTYMKCNWTHCS